VLALLALLIVPPASGATPEEEVRASLAFYVSEPAEVDRLVGRMEEEARGVAGRLRAAGYDPSGIEDAVARNVAENLGEKVRQSRSGPVLPMSAEDIERTVIGYEAFKAESFVTSGVFPKRYFGYFDGKYDTAPLEGRLREATARSVAVIDAWQEEHGAAVRVTDAEVAVTFIAEGGALWLGTEKEKADALHPVLDVGLDDLASGLRDLDALQARLDAELGTGLRELVVWVDRGVDPPEGVVGRLQTRDESGPLAYLARRATLEEAIAGTALMWLWEKEIAAGKLAATDAAPLHSRSLHQQFIIGSLVYNSGLLHNSERWAMIEDLSSGEWLARTSERNAKRRWALNVLPPARALTWLVGGGQYPEQPTAWLAAYHVLQRYGAYLALERFTDTFDEAGAFRD